MLKFSLRTVLQEKKAHISEKLIEFYLLEKEKKQSNVKITVILSWSVP